MYILPHSVYVTILHIVMLINFICGPYLTFKAVKKILEVMNNKVNDSFSKISIWILKMVVVQEVMVMVTLSWVVVLIVYN